MIVHVFAIALWAVSGSAAGLFTGAVLRRIIPIFPIWIWITLHAVIAVVAGLGSAAIAIMSSAAKGIVDVSVGEKLLAGFLVGTVIGVAVGGVEALVLRKVAIGAGRWFACSIAAFAIAVSLFGNARLWETGGGFAGELAHNAITFLGAMTISLVMLPAVRHLRDPLMSKASPHFD